MLFELRVKEIREVRCMTQIELASKIGISQSHLSEIEKREYNIKLSLLCKIACALEIDPWELVIFL